MKLPTSNDYGLLCIAVLVAAFSLLVSTLVHACSLSRCFPPTEDEGVAKTYQPASGPEIRDRNELQRRLSSLQRCKVEEDGDDCWVPLSFRRHSYDPMAFYDDQVVQETTYCGDYEDAISLNL